MVGVAETGALWGSLCADGMESAFLFCLLVILGFYLVGVGAVDDPQDT